MHGRDTTDPSRVSKHERAHRGGTRVSVDELVAKSHTVFDRVVPLLERAAEKLRARFARKPRA